MSETLTSHTQWIQHAIAAAKAGNPSVAKIQLQKAAEENPEDPAIWLWMGWLADSPANATQCLEIARSDVRFEKIAATGIEFSKAMAEFQLESLSGDALDHDQDVQDKVEEQDASKLNPVEAVEEVVAVVEFLQQEDATEEKAVEASEPFVEVAEAELVETASESEGDEASKEEFGDDAQSSSCDEIVSEADRAVSEVAETGDDQPVGPPSSNGVEAELIQTANDLWQSADGMGGEVPTLSGEAGEQLKSGQELWQTVEAEIDSAVPADDHSQVDSIVDVLAEDDENLTEQPVDESEDDFAFASDDEEAFDAESSPRVRSSSVNGTIQPATDVSDQWLEQETAETPREPVWREAQSDWFSVDEPSGSVAEQSLSPARLESISSPSNDEPLVEQDSAVVTESGPLHVESAGDVNTLKTEISDAPALLDEDSVPAVPRVTASDIWQTAAIEKSAMLEAPNVQQPTGHHPVLPNAAQVWPDTNPTAAADSQSPAVRSMADDSVFSAESRIGELLPNDNRTDAGSKDAKTVLVVDDSPTVRKLVAITLEKRGYKVVSAFDGVAAIKEIASHNPSLILMDVNMPRLDGYQLCKLVKKHETTCDIPVLMLTGKDGMFDRLRGRLVGCVGSLAKPFTPEELLEIVEQNIAQVK